MKKMDPNIGTKNTSRHQATADVESRLVSKIQGIVTTSSTMLINAVISTPSECNHSIVASSEKGQSSTIKKSNDFNCVGREKGLPYFLESRIPSLSMTRARMHGN